MLCFVSTTTTTTTNLGGMMSGSEKLKAGKVFLFPFAHFLGNRFLVILQYSTTLAGFRSGVVARQSGFGSKCYSKLFFRYSFFFAFFLFL